MAAVMVRACREGLGHTARLQGDDADAVRPELTGPLSAKTLDGVEGGSKASEQRDGVGRPTERQDHPGSAPDHVSRGRPGGQEVRPHTGRDGSSEVLERHLHQRKPLHVSERDQVEGDVDAPGLAGHSVDIRVDGLLIERVDAGGLGHAAGRADLSGDLVELGPGASGQEDPGPFAGEGAGHRRADRAARSVDHSGLALQQHVDPPLSVWRGIAEPPCVRRVPDLAAADLAGDAAKDAVHEAAGVLGGEQLRQLDRLVQDHGGRHL